MFRRLKALLLLFSIFVVKKIWGTEQITGVLEDLISRQLQSAWFTRREVKNMKRRKLLVCPFNIKKDQKTKGKWRLWKKFSLGPLKLFPKLKCLRENLKLKFIETFYAQSTSALEKGFSHHQTNWRKSSIPLFSSSFLFIIVSFSFIEANWLVV